jgi:hypothetical protein
MPLQLNIPKTLAGIAEIDKKISFVHQLSEYDPILSIIRENFQKEITLHLTSLKARREWSVDDITGQKNPNVDAMKKAYLNYGREIAVTRFIFDISKQKLTAKAVLMLSEILFEEKNFRQKDTYIYNSSGKRTKALSPINIELELKKVFEWYNNFFRKKTYHPIALATALHYQFTLIRPFEDWNGRIARLVLNIALMQNGLLPLLIDADERHTYYEHLETADKGNLEPLTNFFVQKEMETINNFMASPEYLSIQGKFDLENQIKNFRGSEKCIVLTEDSTTNNLLSILLESSGFKMKETNIISYEGCSKLSSANLFSIFVKEKMPSVKIFVHRDRDYLTDAEIETQRDSFRRIGAYLFVTEGTDIESYFLNASHLNFCHPKINLQLASQLIKETVEEVFSKSVDYLRKKEFGGNKPAMYTHLNKAMEDMVRNNLYRFTHGKTAYKVLQYKIHDHAKQKANLEKVSKYLFIKELNQFSHSIWRKKISN